jgi:hypothetical protein
MRRSRWTAILMLVGAACLAWPSLADAQYRRRSRYGRSSGGGGGDPCTMVVVCGGGFFMLFFIAWAIESAGKRKTVTRTYVPPRLRLDDSPALLQIQWNALPLVTRQRLVAAQKDPVRAGCFWLGEVKRESRLRGFTLPDPSVRVKRALAACAVVAPLTFVGLAVVGFEDPYSEWMWQGAGELATYTIALGLGLWGATHVARKTLERPRRDYRDGCLLGPAAIIEFRGACVRVHALTAATGLRLDDKYSGQNREYLPSYGNVLRYRIKSIYSHTEVTVSFEHGHLGFNVGLDLHDYLVRTAEVLRVLSATPPGAAAQALYALDLFFEARRNPAWPAMLASGTTPGLPPPTDGGPTCGLPAVAPRALRLPGYVTALVALVLGPSAWLARNYVSDSAAWQAAKGMGLGGLQAYERNGWLYTAEARDALFFLEASAPEQPERTLQDFVRDHPRHARVAEARALIRERFIQASRRYATQSAPPDPAVTRLMQRVLDFQERQGSPPIVVRFAPPTDAAVNASDVERAALARARGVTPVALAPNFAEGEMRPRERYVVDELSAAFRAALPEGIVRFEDGGRANPTGAAAGVRFDVSYALAPTGEYMAWIGEAEDVPGADFVFNLRVTVPDGGAPFVFTTTVVPSYGELDVAHAAPSQGSRAGSATCGRAFMLFTDRLRGLFFREGSPARGGVTPDDSPSQTLPVAVFGRRNATLTRALSATPSPVRVVFTRGGRGVTGTYRGVRGGPLVAEGTIDGVLSGQVLTATCANAEGASGPCTFTFSRDGRRFAGMMTLGGVRHYWTD